MLTITQKNTVISSIPTTYNGKPWNKARSYELQREPTVPRIIVTFLTEGVRMHFAYDKIRRIIPVDSDIPDEHYGRINAATCSIIFESHLREDVLKAADELQMFFLKGGHVNLWDQARVQFYQFLDMRELPALYDERTGKHIYRTIIDFRILYETSWQDETPPIEKVRMRIIKDDTAEVKL